MVLIFAARRHAVVRCPSVRLSHVRVKGQMCDVDPSVHCHSFIVVRAVISGKLSKRDPLLTMEHYIEIGTPRYVAAFRSSPDVPSAIFWSQIEICSSRKWSHLRWNLTTRDKTAHSLIEWPWTPEKWPWPWAWHLHANSLETFLQSTQLAIRK